MNTSYWKKTTYISKNVYMASSPIFYVSRLLGLAPLSLSKRGSRYLIKWSPKYTIYSFILGFIIGALAILGMVNDLRADTKTSVRMKNTTSKYITSGDIMVVVVIVLIGIVGAPLRWSKIFHLIECINEVDSIITINDAKKARKTAIITLSTIFLLTSLLLGGDLYIWYGLASQSGGSDLLIKNYVPFYLSYYIVMALECQYWYLAVCIKRRLKILNDCLNFENFEDNYRNFSAQASIYSTALDMSPKEIGNIIDKITRNRKVSDLLFVKNVNNFRTSSTIEYIFKLTRVHGKLCEAVVAINQSYGLTILVMITSCLLHLIVTPYFLLQELNGRHNNTFLALQFSWVGAHACRLLIIVEPCYAAVVEANNTNPQVCRLLCSEVSDPFKKQLELFSVQLLHRDIEFSACGLARIDRHLITAIAGAVTTYLVILIQFQKS